MRKRRPDEVIKRFRPENIAELKKLARKAARWAKDHVNDLRQADPKMLEPMSDRTADNWRPLFAIADAASSHWPNTARKVALQLSRGLEDPSSEVQLLANIRAAFNTRDEDRLSSESLGKIIGIEPNPLARRLRPFGVKPYGMRLGGKTLRGYLLTDFEDTFARYLPRESATLQHSKETKAFNDVQSATKKADVAVQKAP